jgi:hypothetical protein
VFLRRAGGWRGISESTVVKRPLHSRLQKGSQFAEDFIPRVNRESACKFGLSRAPIQTLYLISQNDTANRQTLRHRHFKGIALHLTRDRTEQAEPDLPVVRPGGDDNGRPAPSLLMAGLRIQADWFTDFTGGMVDSFAQDGGEGAGDALERNGEDAGADAIRAGCRGKVVHDDGVVRALRDQPDDRAQVAQAPQAGRLRAWRTDVERRCIAPIGRIRKSLKPWSRVDTSTPTGTPAS